jgi:hypothetical protein
MQRHYHINQTGTFFTPISVIYSQLNQRAISTSPTNQKILTFRPTSQLNSPTNQKTFTTRPTSNLHLSNQSTFLNLPTKQLIACFLVINIYLSTNHYLPNKPTTTAPRQIDNRLPFDQPTFFIAKADQQSTSC